MSEYVVASREDVRDGERVVAEVDGIEIAVFNVDGEYHACLNYCTHEGGPLCEGPVVATVDASFDAETLETEVELTRRDEVVVCPWHNWEFDVTTGECLSHRDSGIPTYPVSVRDGDIVVEV